MLEPKLYYCLYEVSSPYDRTAPTSTEMISDATKMFCRYSNKTNLFLATRIFSLQTRIFSLLPGKKKLIPRRKKDLAARQKILSLY